MGVARGHGSVVLLEFNELSPSLMRRFIDQGELLNFKRFHDESHVYVSDAEESPPNLEPWIQWVTLHSGLPFDEHRIFYLGDGPKLERPCLWDAVSAAGRSVWVCGSMNIRHDVPIRGCVLPDPWTDAVGAHPASLEPFRSFVRQHVLEHTSDRVPLRSSDYARFIAFMAGHGLHAATVQAIVSQLIAERGGGRRWRRAVLLDKLQFDLFRWYFQRSDPALSTFFINSTAHFQHMYWRNMDPRAFDQKPSESEQAEYRDAIQFGYREMDQLLGRFLELAGDRATLVLATALSQQPCVLYEARGGKVLHRARDVRGLLEFAGVKEVSGAPRISPVMSTDFHLEFGRAEDASHAAACLDALRIGERPAMNVELDGRVVVAGPTTSPVPEDARLTSPNTGRSAPFFEIFYRAEGMKSGMHHPDGLLWIRRPSREHAVHQEKVGLTSVAPTLLEMLGVPRPPSMRGAPLEDVLG